jgi:hypothetical protein
MVVVMVTARPLTEADPVSFPCGVAAAATPIHASAVTMAQTATYFFM